MCVAVVVDSKERIPRKYLKAMHDANSHGAGVAWCDGDLIHYRKGLTWQEIDALQDVLPRPFFMHFRIATHGDRIPELTHPFPLGMQAFSEDLVGSAEAVLIHNGTWHDFRRWVPGGIDVKAVSDTQVAAYVAADFEEILSQVQWSNAVMRAAGNNRVNITLRGRWNEFEGNQYSNMYWKRELDSPPVYSHQTRGSQYDDYYSKYGSNFGPVARTKTEPMSHKVNRNQEGGRKIDKGRKKGKYLGRKTTTDEEVNQGAWGTGEELFTKEELEPRRPSAKCPDCNQEITQIPCVCALIDIEQCPNPRCKSYNCSFVDDDYWFCEECYTGFVPSSTFKKVEERFNVADAEVIDLEDLVLSGDKTGDQSKVNDVIRQQGIKIVPTE